MEVYPYKSPLILTEDIFVQCGGMTGSSLPVQRQAAFLLAEMQMTSYLGTFLLPTIVTGSRDYHSPYEKNISTEYGYVSNLFNVRVLNPFGGELWNLSGSLSHYAYINDDTFGYIRYQDIWGKCGYYCGNWVPETAYIDGVNKPAKMEYVYQAGLPTGTANFPSMLLALTMAAQISLNEMVFPFSNESSGDVGVEEFRSLQYSEKRKPWKNSEFGASPKAAKICQLVDSTVKKARKAIVFR